eukprot:CAMPEP_0182824444 /NCGR_PEP_ID=MMETSP0006_2-20121128/15293_1 /TAXON_ID=97485 /ORGANISM="Prymnesium parvum, Strain Texoma1" /LENGTH=150 /DNA_ID=CAMNT_0024951441 /DNA_START=130 /DNA_END=579 /DNA_ORIENTATION=-
MVATVAPSSPVHTSTGAPAAPMAHDDISSMMRRAIRLSVPAVRLQQSAENPGATHAAYEVCLHAVGKHSADAVLVLSSWRRWSECAAFAREKGVAKRFPSHPADTLAFLGSCSPARSNVGESSSRSTCRVRAGPGGCSVEGQEGGGRERS